jgi:hypothetical protein
MIKFKIKLWNKNMQTNCVGFLPSESVNGFARIILPDCLLKLSFIHFQWAV